MAVCAKGCGRLIPAGSNEEDCEVCRGNMARWSLEPLEHIEHYDEQLNVRKARIDEVRHATKNSYVGRLKAKRDRKKRALSGVTRRRNHSAHANT